MNVVDVILILALLGSLYLGFNNEMLRSLYDLFILTICSIAASLLSKIIIKPLYKFLPFFNFNGKVQGIKAVNIIFWRIIFLVLIFLMLVWLIDRFMVKKQIKSKVIDLTITFSIIPKIIGSFVYIFVVFIVLFDILLVLRLPNFNIKYVKESKVANTIVNKVPVLHGINKDLIDSQTYALNKLKGNVTKDNYRKINELIIDNLIQNKMVSSNTVSYLKSKGKLKGTRKKIIIEQDYTNDENDTSYPNDDSSTDDTNNNNTDDINDNENEEETEDGYISDESSEDIEQEDTNLNDSDSQFEEIIE